MTKASSNNKARWHHRVRRGLKDHFIPHEGNDHVPHVLKHRVLFGYSLLFILLKVLVVVVPVALPASSVYSSAITPSNIIELTNQARENVGLNDLAASPKLTSAAQEKAQDMMVNQYFAHTSPAGVTPWAWIHGVGYDYDYAGENLAVYFTQAEDVQAGWMASPSHRANIVSDKYTEIGIGVVNGNFQGYETTVVVQMFGKPKEVAVEVASAPASEPVPEPAPAPAPQEAVEEPAPVVVSEPAPTSTPVVESATAVTVDTSNAVVVPTAGAYEVSVPVANADAVSVQVAGEETALTETEPDTWTGTVPVEPNVIDAHGESLDVIASGDAEHVVEPIAYVAPAAQVQDVYTFTDSHDKSFRFLGLFTVNHLDDDVRQFYIYSMLALGAVLLMGMMWKIHERRPTVFAHGLVVIALAFLLTLF